VTKRFYERAEAVARAEGHAVTLDGRSIRTPARADLLVPTRALAEAIAAEWNAQGDRIDHRSMVHMQLACTAIDGVCQNTDGVVDALVAYGETDLLCYRAEEPAALVERQAQGWQPLLDWAESRYGVRFAVTSGIVPVDQPPETLAPLRACVRALDPFRLTGLQALAGSLGSLVLALAVLESRLSAAEAFALSQLDEEHQARQWGADEEAEQRKAAMLVDVQGSESYLRALSG